MEDASNMSHAPNSTRCAAIYTDRASNDLAYAMLSSANMAKLDPHVEGIRRLLHNQSPCVQGALQKVLDSNDPNVKHAVILFALHAEPSFRAYIAKHSNERVLGEFVNNELPRRVSACLTGHYDSLKTFVRDARCNFLTT